MSSYVSNSISGGISFSGLGSGTDFTEMIAQLKTVEEIPKNRMTLWQGEWEYRTAAMEEVMTVMQEARGTLRDYDSMSKMMDVKVETSEEDVATATIDPNADLTEGSYSIDVEQLAKASLFSTVKMFDKKTSVINNSGVDQDFSYTYKGVSRTIACPTGTTLEQLLLRINNDAENPGVRASLIKNGDQYMFQVQGKDTGVDSQLSVSSSLDGFDNNHLFTAEDVSITNSNAGFSIFHEGKSYTTTVAAGTTAGEFVDAFNADSDNPGLTAYLARDGANYTIKYKDKSSGYAVNPPVTTNIPALGGQTGVASTTTPINDTGTVQNYTYSYLGKNYSVPVATTDTLSDLLTSINSSTDAVANGVTAYIDPPSGSGPFNIKMQKQDAILNGTGASQTVEYANAGTTDPKYTFEVPAGATVKDYARLFNENAKANRVDARVKVDETTVPATLLYTKADGLSSGLASPIGFLSGTDAAISAGIAHNSTHTIATMPHDGGATSILEGLGKKEIISGKDTIVNDGPALGDYSAPFAGPPPSTLSISNIPVGTTLDQFVTQFNAANTSTTTNPQGIKAVLIEGASGYSLGFEDSTGAVVKPIIDDPNTTGNEGVGTNMPSLKSGGNNWYEQEAQDAKFTVNGWDTVLTSSSNKLTEVIDGMTITIKDEGKAQLNVASDSSKLQDNIYAIIDTLNLVKATILKLQEVDTDKPVGSPDDDKEMASQFTWQAGSALTGNYGVQMLLSSFSGITSGAGAGFVGMTNTEDTLNDPFTALSQIGISTVTNPAEEDFGLLRIDSEKLDEAIKKDADAVAELFSAKLSGSTNSSDFTVASAGLHAKAGSYDVEYEVNAAGSVTDAWINGVRAATDPAYPGRFTVADSTNDAVGVAIQFNSGGLAPTVSPNRHKGEIRIKQGKVNEMASFLDDELRRTSIKGEEQGTLPTIISNYAEISKNIQKKIDRETKRIGVWETRMKLKFARLDTLLGTQNALLESMGSMLPPQQ